MFNAHCTSNYNIYARSQRILHHKRILNSVRRLSWNFIVLNCVVYPGGVTKRCRLYWLANSALVYVSPNAGGRGALRGLKPTSEAVHLYKGAQINFGQLTPYLTYEMAGQICGRFLANFVQKGSERDRTSGSFFSFSYSLLFEANTSNIIFLPLI
jgi:peptidoglycan hydrolase-like protein with peptidoglycan-binding domain